MRQGAAAFAVAAVLILVRGDSLARVGAQAATPVPRATPQAAHLLIDVSSGRVLSSAAPDVLHTPVLPGSIAKIAILVAALETGVIRPDTSLLCRRQIVSEGHRYTCSHPVLSRPLSPSDALAHSCNCYFASIAPRVRRDAFNRALALLGLPPSDHRVVMSVAGLGLGGVHATSEQLVRGFARFVASRPPSLSPATWDLVRAGLAEAAVNGTASAFGERGLSALAKTGTAPMPAGGYQGLVVAASPSSQPTRAIVVLAPGTSGSEAARLAAALLARGGGSEAAATGARSLRIGRVGRDGRYHVESVELEDYVARVVAGEATQGGHAEEAKALAIAARTFAEANRSRHAREGFDLCDLTHCQALREATAASRSAAEATRGLVVRDRAGLAAVFYSASCGGRSEAVADAWVGGVDVPYLVMREEPECASASKWQTELPAASLEQALRAAGLRGTMLRHLAVATRTRSGRVGQVSVEGFEPPRISGPALRTAVGRTLGWQHLKSTLFDVERTAGGYRFTGRGSGHGVGLCVMGAGRRARSGQPAEAILQVYFPGTRVEPLAAAPPGSPRVAVVLPAGHERAEAEIRDLALSVLNGMAKRTTLSLPDNLRLVFHDSVESYGRATGQPWWTAGSTRGTESHFIPLPALRRQRQLARTVAHELAHGVVGERLAGEPLWVQEGAAMYLGGELALQPAQSRRAAVDCPSDDEIRGARSREDARRAYSRIAACFAQDGRNRAAAVVR